MSQSAAMRLLSDEEGAKIRPTRVYPLEYYAGTGVLAPVPTYIVDDHIMAVALTGTLLPGSVVLVSEAQNKGAVVSYAFGRSWYNPRWTDVGFIWPRIDTLSRTLPEGLWAVRAGEVLDFGRPLRGLAAVCVGPEYANLSYTGVNEVAPDLVVYREAGQRIVSPTYCGGRGAISTHVSGVEPMQPGVDILGGAVARWHPSMKRVRITANGSYPGDLSVYWLRPGHVFHHNDADDFDSSGLGAVSSTHTSETYDTNGYCGVAVMDPSNGLGDVSHGVVYVEVFP